MAAHNYLLRVTAGPSYDMKDHKVVAVNTPEPLSFSTEHMDIDLNVRIQHYHGLPHSSPPSSPYFLLPTHAKSGDQYSIAFHFTPHESINGNDLVFGNDFDHPIRDRLPPGFGTAFKIVKWAIDPGLDGDVYADKPYLYGPLASSLNILRVGAKSAGGKKAEGQGKGKEHMGDKGEGMVFEEGAEGDGAQLRSDKGVPDAEAARKKWFLTEANRQAWEFEAGREHGGDFFNPYLDFNDFALRLPGFTLPIMKYWDGQGLRYVLKNRTTNTVYLVVLFTLYQKEDVDPHTGEIKEGVVAGKPLEPPSGHHDGDWEREEGGNVHEEARTQRPEGKEGGGKEGEEGGGQKAVVETSADDVD